MSRECPRCHVAFEALRKPFATLDACPRCGGLFLEPGDGAALRGAASDPTFLVKDGRARRVGASALVCPSDAHPAQAMDVFAVGEGSEAVEIDACPTCGGVFLDRGEDQAIEERVSGVPHSPFEKPPLSNQEIAIAEMQASTEERPGWRGIGHDTSLVGDIVGLLGRLGRHRYGRRHPR